MTEILTSQSLIDSSALMYEKQLVINKRGLASFPYNTEEDIRLINKIKRRRDQLNNHILQLPRLPLSIYLDPLLTDDLIYYLALGDYEESDLFLLKKYIQKGDRILDVGGGAGICACAMAYYAQNKVYVVEARQDLKNLIYNNLELNNLHGEVIHGVVVDDLPENSYINFVQCQNLWFSSLEGTTEGTVIQAPVLHLDTIYSQVKPHVVLLDIEGAETRLNWNTQYKPRHIIIEIHTPSIGSEQTCSVIQKIINAGYFLKDVSSQTWVFENKNKEI